MSMEEKSGKWYTGSMSLLRKIGSYIGVSPVRPIAKSATDRQPDKQETKKAEALKLSREATRAKFHAIFSEYRITDTEHLRALALRTNNEFEQLSESPDLDTEQKDWITRMRQQRNLARRIFIDTGEVKQEVYDALEKDAAPPPEPRDRLDILG